MNDDVKEVAKAIGGSVARACHLTVDSTNRVFAETRMFGDIAMAAADGFEKKYVDLLEQAEKFTYTVKTLTEKDYPSAFNALENGICWLNEHKNEVVDKSFIKYYMYGYSLDIFKSEIKIARESAGLTQQQFSDMFGVSLNTVKSWDCGRRRPDKLKEKLILEKLTELKKDSH